MKDFTTGEKLVPLKEAARLLRMSPHVVRDRLQKNLFVPPIGYAEDTNSGSYKYCIYRDMLNRYLEQAGLFFYLH